MDALKRAIEHFGSQTAFAEAIGTGQSRVSMWLNRGTTPEPAQCVLIERATSGKVGRQDLRPDDWHLIWPELAKPKRTTKPAKVEG